MGRGGDGEREDSEPRRRRRSRHLDSDLRIDPSDYELLGKFITEHGRIMPSRLTGVTAHQQRQIKKAIRRARGMGILP